MKITRAVTLLLCFTLAGRPGIYAHAHAERITADTIPSMLQGSFMDDYGIRYNINDTLWTQVPNVKYHIISWDTAAQYLLARNDGRNPSEAGLYTRIDYMSFNNMALFFGDFALLLTMRRPSKKPKQKQQLTG